MGRSAESWKLKLDPRTGIRSVRFRHKGTRYDLSTGKRDPADARAEAVRIYADVVTGKTKDRVRGSADEPLVDLMAEFFADIDGEVTAGTHRGYRYMAFGKIAPFFVRVSRFTTTKIADYIRGRLKSVQRATVSEELKVIRRFVAWCIGREVLPQSTVCPPIPKGALGTKASKRKVGTVHISAIEARAIVAALPERRSKGGLVIRARFALQWETSLRQATIGRLRVPEHYQKGAHKLVITDPIDKARFGRELPLTDAARAALDSVCPDDGSIFGEYTMRVFVGYLRKAATSAGLPPHKADAFSAYDLRHGRITALLTGGAPLTAVAYLAGHKLITTTNAYVSVAHAAEAAADALRASGGISGGTKHRHPAKRGKKQQ